MSRKILLIFGTVLGVIYSNDFELYFSVLLTIVAYVLQVWNNPYETKQLNLLESISLLSSEIVCFCALYFKLINRRKELDIIMVIFGFVGNLFFVIAFAREFIKVKLKDIRRNKTAIKILNFIRLKICCCYRDSPLWKKLGVGNASVGFAAHFIGGLQRVNVNSDVDAGEGEGASSSEGGRTAKKEIEGVPDIISPTNQQLLISFPDGNASPSKVDRFGSLTGQNLMSPMSGNVSKYLANIEEDSMMKSPMSKNDNSFGNSPTKLRGLSKYLDEDNNFAKSPVNKPPSKHIMDEDEDSFTKASPTHLKKQRTIKPPKETPGDAKSRSKSRSNSPKNKSPAVSKLLDEEPVLKPAIKSQVASWLKFPDDESISKSPTHKRNVATSNLFDASPRSPAKKVTLMPPNDSYDQNNALDKSPNGFINDESLWNSPQFSSPQFNPIDKKPVINLSKTPESQTPNTISKLRLDDDAFPKSPLNKQGTKPPKTPDESRDETLMKSPVAKLEIPYLIDEDSFSKAPENKPTINLKNYSDEDTQGNNPLNKSPTNMSKYLAQIGDNSFGADSPMNRSPTATRDRLEPGTPFGVGKDKQKLAFSLGDVLNEVQYEDSSMNREESKREDSPPKEKKDDILEKEGEQIVSEPPSGVNEFDSERQEIELYGKSPRASPKASPKAHN